MFPAGMISLDSVREIGSGLNRPECVLAHSSGYLFAADWEGMGGVSLVAPDGTVRKILAKDRDRPLRPNGIALEPDGSFLLAHLGEGEGGVYRLYPDGTSEAVLTHVGGQALPPTNFVLLDADGRRWITVSTRKSPRALGYRVDGGDGFVVLMDEAGARIVADNLGYANECALAPDGSALYVNETFSRQLTRFELDKEGNCRSARTVATFGPGTFPDGLAFDREDGLWVTSIVSNRIIRVLPNGDQLLRLEDCDTEHLLWVEAAYESGTMGRPHLDDVRSSRLRNVSCLAFGGGDSCTAYLGCLLGDTVAMFRSDVPGRKPLHWDFDLSNLELQ